MNLKILYRKFNEKKSSNYYLKLRKKLTNKDFTLISNNCLGGVIYHNLGLQFKSPTINLDFLPEHYLAFISDLYFYASRPIIEVPGMKIITGVIRGDDCHDDVFVRFHHYNSFEEAREKWEIRCKRINYNNLFFLYEHYEDEKIECLLKFCSFASGNSNYMAITHKLHNVQNEMLVKNYKNDAKSGKLFKWKRLTGRKYLDDIDYTSWLNHDPGFWD